MYYNRYSGCFYSVARSVWQVLKRKNQKFDKIVCSLLTNLFVSAQS